MPVIALIDSINSTKLTFVFAMRIIRLVARQIRIDVTKEVSNEDGMTKRIEILYWRTSRRSRTGRAACYSLEHLRGTSGFLTIVDGLR
jgi:hypothetical protein